VFVALPIFWRSDSERHRDDQPRPSYCRGNTVFSHMSGSTMAT